MHSHIFSKFGKLNWTLLIVSGVLLVVIVCLEFALTIIDKTKPFFYRDYCVVIWFACYCLVAGAFAAPIFKLRVQRDKVGLVIISTIAALLALGILVWLSSKRLAVQTGDMTLVSVLITTAITLLLLFVKFQIDASARRTSHSLDVLLQMRTSEVYNKHVKNVNRLYPSGQDAHITLEDFEKFQKMDVKALYAAQDENKEDIILFEAIKSQAYVLNYFEFLALGIKNLILEEEILYQSLGGIFVRTYKQSETLIEQSGDVKTFCEIKALYASWFTRREQDKANFKR
jgi:hypothetical protein